MSCFETELKSNNDNMYKELFIKHEHNPILTAKDWHYPINTVFNPGAISYKGKTLLLVRVEDRRGFSHLTKAVSENGIDNWIIDESPTFASSPDYPAERWGVEDPRITYVDELEQFVIIYTSYSVSGPTVSMAMTNDFCSFVRFGTIMPPEDKDAALFPRQFNKKWMLIHRPIEHGEHIWISSSDNLKYWGDHKILIDSREGCWWDGAKVGLSAPPMETPEGWLILYHGVKLTASGAIYRVGLALLDLENPTIVKRRSDEWIFGPKEPYEKYGDVQDVVFPCGWILDEQTRKVRMYYGGADSCVALATANIDDMISYILSCPDPRNKR